MSQKTLSAERRIFELHEMELAVERPRETQSRQKEQEVQKPVTKPSFKLSGKAQEFLRIC